jgi:hypothetical protein
MKVPELPLPDQAAATPPRRSATGLRPCPFCGAIRLASVSVPDPAAGAAKALLIQCEECGATGPCVTDGNLSKLRLLWDTRHASL